MNLTKQEKKVAHLIASEYSEKEIASMLFVAESTVHTHARNIRKKLKVKSIAGVTREFVLAFGDPKQFIAVFLLTIQCSMFFTAEYDVMRRPNRMRVVKVKKVRRKV